MFGRRKKLSKRLRRSSDRPNFHAIVVQYFQAIYDQHQLELTLSEAALAEHEDLLDPLGCPLTTPNLELRVIAIGSFLGEVMVHNLCGKWKKEGNTWVVAIDNKTYSPFQQARRRLIQGRVESLEFFFDVIKRSLSERKHGVPDSSGANALLGFLEK